MSHRTLHQKATAIIQESDLDGDGKVTKEEFIDFMHKNDKRATRIFVELDTDRDGKLTVVDIINHDELRHLNLRRGIITILNILKYIANSIDFALEKYFNILRVKNEDFFA